MPWVSKAQRGWAHATGQPWAAKWDAHTPEGARLPAHAAYGGTVPTEAELRKFHVLSGGHLPDPTSETQVCLNCGYSFGGEIDDNFTPPPEPEPDLISSLAEALRRIGRY